MVVLLLCVTGAICRKFSHLLPNQYKTLQSFILSELCTMRLVESVTSLLFVVFVSSSQLCSKPCLLAFLVWLTGMQGEVTR